MSSRTATPTFCDSGDASRSVVLLETELVPAIGRLFLAAQWQGAIVEHHPLRKEGTGLRIKSRQFFSV